MRCILCGRTLRAATAWTLGKPIGPVCAARRGMSKPAGKRKAYAPTTPAPVDARQLPLDLPA